MYIIMIDILFIFLFNKYTMGNIIKMCSCVEQQHERCYSNIKINALSSSIIPTTNNITTTNNFTEGNSNMIDSSRVVSANERNATTPNEQKHNFIESYNSKNNFFYYINKISKIQLFYKARFKKKQNDKKKLKPAKTINTVYVSNNFDNEGEDKKNETEDKKDETKDLIKSGDQFNYREFRTHISCMDVNTFSQNNNNDNNDKKITSHKPNQNIRQEMNKHKTTKNYINAMIKRKTEHKKIQLKFPNQEECSLTKYMTCCEASFCSAFKSTIYNDNNRCDNEPRGCFLRKKLKFKFQGSVNVDTKKKEGFGKITWKDESFLLTTFTNNRANGLTYYKDKPNVTEFSGYYIDNNPNGYGLHKTEGIITEGIWDKNILTGIGREYSNQDSYYQGDFTNSLKHGIGLFRWKDGTMYKGEWNKNQMTGFGLISYNDDKLYLGQLNNGIMEGYGEFYWEKEYKQYLGYYKNDLKHGFGIYVSNYEELLIYIGFWEKGKMNGVGLTIKGKTFKYGVWKNGSNEKWLQGPWELRKHIINQSHLKFLKLLEMSQNKIMDLLNKLEINFEVKTDEE